MRHGNSGQLAIHLRGLRGFNLYILWFSCYRVHSSLFIFICVYLIFLVYFCFSLVILFYCPYLLVLFIYLFLIYFLYYLQFIILFILFIVFCFFLLFSFTVPRDYGYMLIIQLLIYRIGNFVGIYSFSLNFILI